HGTEVLKHIFDISRQVLADFNFYEFYKIQKHVIYQDKISYARLIDTSRNQTSAAEVIECLHTWLSENDIKEAIRFGFNKAVELANYFEINNYTVVSIQQLVTLEDKNIGIATFEITQLLLDEFDNNEDNEDKNEMANPSILNFSDLQYILNKDLIPQKQFENFNAFFTPEGFYILKS
ncbi:12114_t:CDS:2, partial [Funneliformis geosporum]